MKKVAMLVFTCVSFSLQAQIVPVHFGTKSALYNEFGVLLDGTASAPGALVQILDAKLGVFPPAVSGTPHPDNPVLTSAFIGQGTDPVAGPLGKVSGSVRMSRSGASVPIYARIFNKPTMEESSFYTDSQVYFIPVEGSSYGVFHIQASQTDTELDTSDDDGDGLSRSWERSYGTDPENPDSDNDGMLDGHEILAGTDPLDGGSLLMMVELMPAGGGNLLAMWDSVPGKTYQLEYTTSSLTDDNPFADINGPVTAVADMSYTTVTNGTVPPSSNFRVRLVLPSE